MFGILGNSKKLPSEPEPVSQFSPLKTKRHNRVSGVKLLLNVRLLSRRRADRTDRGHSLVIGCHKAEPAVGAGRGGGRRAETASSG